MPVHRGEVLVTSNQEHPAVEVPLELLRIPVEKIDSDDPDEFVRRVERLVVTKPVKVILLSHVSYKDGRVLPVEEIGQIARRAGVAYVLDGSQAAGHVKIELGRIKPSIYVFSGHKWLFGSMGTGGMWVDDGLIGKYRPDGKWSNWLTEHGKSNGGQFESGTVNLALSAGLLRAINDAAAEFVERHELLVQTRDKIERHLFGQPHLKASSWTGEKAPGILAYRLADDKPSWVVADKLYRNDGIVVKPFKPPEEPNAIRISFSPHTQEADIDRLVHSLTDVLRSEIHQAVRQAE